MYYESHLRLSLTEIAERMSRRPVRRGLVLGVSLIILSFWLIAPLAHAAGTLTPVGAPQQPIQIQDHHVDVKIHPGFARVEVTQTYFNPNAQEFEAVYSMPVPKKGALSEFTIFAGEKEINGEVLPRNKANEVYEEERSKGNDAGVANKNSYQNYEFKVARVPAQAETKIQFVYYQPITLDTGVGTFRYPLEEGGTDEVGASFWTRNERVEKSFSAHFDIRTGYPIDSVRVPGFEAATTVNTLEEGHVQAEVAIAGGDLSKDLVVYYRLAENLPGRVELIPYRESADKPGTFMLVVTPGLDLKPVTNGADYTFVLDTSGSMAGKLQTLVAGVKKGIGELRAEDRFRIVTFSDTATNLTSGWQNATPENVASAINDLYQVRAQGSTNLYEGIDLGLSKLDDDRVSSVVLVTDGVTNTGILDPKEFRRLMKQVDVRLFGFLLGNSSNWPLMKVVTEASGGFYQGVSNSDDIIGQIMLAKSKITHEALHDAKLSVRGAKVFDTTDEVLGKVYRGQQLVILGRYDEAGQARVKLEAKMSGQDQTYETLIDLPEVAPEFPELERLWAFERIEDIEYQMDIGDMREKEGSKAIEDLGVAFQLVTDETSMVVLDDEAFKRHGIERRNKDRVARERSAQVSRYSQPVQNRRVDSGNSMFRGRSAPGLSGGGALDPLTGFLFGLLALLPFRKSMKSKK